MWHKLFKVKAVLETIIEAESNDEAEKKLRDYLQRHPEALHVTCERDNGYNDLKG